MASHAIREVFKMNLTFLKLPEGGEERRRRCYIYICPKSIDIK